MNLLYHSLTDNLLAVSGSSLNEHHALVHTAQAPYAVGLRLNHRTEATAIGREYLYGLQRSVGRNNQFAGTYGVNRQFGIRGGGGQSRQGTAQAAQEVATV